MSTSAVIVATEVGYDCYIGSIHLASVKTQIEAEACIRTSQLPWSGEIVRTKSIYMPCQ